MFSGPPETTLAYMLSSAGFDVWLTNRRGNMYARSHDTLDPDDEETKKAFWDFSIDQTGPVDLANVIQYVRSLTKADTLHYIGHSMASLELVSLLSSKPEYNQLIKTATLLSPVVYIDHMTNPLKDLALILDQFELLIEQASYWEFMKVSTDQLHALAILCSAPDMTNTCLTAMFGFIGADMTQLNSSLVSTYMDHAVSPTPTKILIHFIQIYQDKRPQTFRDNLNLTEPLEYLPELVTVPMMLVSGNRDSLEVGEDVERLDHRLPNVVEHIRTDNYHTDYVLAMDEVENYLKIVDFIQNFR